MCRRLSVPLDPVHPAPRLRLLPDPGLRSVDADRHPVVGLVLDQRRSVAGARLDRPADRAHDDDPVDRGQRSAAQGILHQGDRRLDVDVPRVRLHRAARVRRRQRSRSSKGRPYPALDTAASVRSAVPTAAGPAAAAEGPREPARSGE